MKFEWMKRPERMIPCRVNYKGEPQDLLLHHLTGADTDEIDRLYPPVLAPVVIGEDGKPVKGADGLPLRDTTDLGYLAADQARTLNRAAHLAVLALGHEHFEARELEEQKRELRRPGDGFNDIAVFTIAATVYQAAQMTPAVLEAAKDGVRPTESAG